ncbi:unnamed protein product [Mycena citricolor]|uniref:Uncharacterized protein n=1 Tax=Mycena citricolor TaxID=2018698 RepID=A0AAD2HN36_9AGAR|nr:unnamed protein product [Mycena citricolor]
MQSAAPLDCVARVTTGDGMTRGRLSLRRGRLSLRDGQTDTEITDRHTESRRPLHLEPSNLRPKHLKPLPRGR